MILATYLKILFSQKDFIEQLQQGFSDSTPKAGSDKFKKAAKSLISAL